MRSGMLARKGDGWCCGGMPPSGRAGLDPKGIGPNIVGVPGVIGDNGDIGGKSPAGDAARTLTGRPAGVPGLT